MFGDFFRDFLPDFIYLDLDSAASVLSSTFTSLMTMMTFSFSAILVVLTTYSSQFSPRTINNFLTNTSAKHTLGLFIMTTVYGISNLFLVRTADEGVVLSSWDQCALSHWFGLGIRQVHPDHSRLSHL